MCCFPCLPDPSLCGSRMTALQLTCRIPDGFTAPRKQTNNKRTRSGTSNQSLPPMPIRQRNIPDLPKISAKRQHCIIMLQIARHESVWQIETQPVLAMASQCSRRSVSGRRMKQTARQTRKATSNKSKSPHRTNRINVICQPFRSGINSSKGGRNIRDHSNRGHNMDATTRR